MIINLRVASNLSNIQLSLEPLHTDLRAEMKNLLEKKLITLFLKDPVQGTVCE